PQPRVRPGLRRGRAGAGGAAGGRGQAAGRRRLPLGGELRRALRAPGARAAAEGAAGGDRGTRPARGRARRVRALLPAAEAGGQRRGARPDDPGAQVMLDANQVFPNRVAGVIRSQDAGAAYHACLAAVRGGVGTVEVTTGVPDWAEVVRRLVAEAGPTPVGVGTVVEPAMVAAAAAAGAGFVVTPYLVPEVAAAAREHDLFLVMGALTPTLFPPDALEAGDWARIEGLARRAVAALAAVT